MDESGKSSNAMLAAIVAVVAVVGLVVLWSSMRASTAPAPEASVVGGAVSCPDGEFAITWYYDYDKDTYGTSSQTKVSCSQPSGYVGRGGDCKDTDRTVYPGAAERCDNLNNDCDQYYDEGCDDDNDAFCDANMITVGYPSTCLAGGGDCADNFASVYPGNGC
jgi:hypothetical protein